MIAIGFRPKWVITSVHRLSLAGASFLRLQALRNLKSFHKNGGKKILTQSVINSFDTWGSKDCIAVILLLGGIPRVHKFRDWPDPLSLEFRWQMGFPVRNSYSLSIYKPEEFFTVMRVTSGLHRRK
ncbi:hypothetical protein CEXT_477271 [Caerostris extrusa]|uniref:Uncharacterized protein n=1 Tax=Caerostris extrusa TaxID=172846 RepID=A0AAV4VF83_CAEEX|nr:hypothetical protein CEXT_477271 [Caerostris extrusa]